MEKNDLTFPAKIDKRGNIYVPKSIRDFLEDRGDIDELFMVTIENRE